MSYIKKRVPRKPGQTPQEIVADQKSLSNWFTDNINLVVYTSGSILLVLVLFLGFTWMKTEKRDSANSALSGAMALYQTTIAALDEDAGKNSEQLEMALASLHEVATEYADAPQGHAASLFKANVLYRLGRYQEAAATIEELDARNHELVANINAFYLLARSYEAMGDYKSAIDSYLLAKDQTLGDMKAVIEIDLARCHELSGEKDTAISIYKEILSDFPDTVFSTRAQKKLATLGFIEQETL